ncbi:hypothetical protein WA026_017561 [Henosepilachna vigintioctopunctata]|uniref:MADF domain-containing protein n=1 Tax=Henosepilachna vigintioctopunctata TaxID=420089 RepID=A0AAW1V350_9CUCU
MEHYKLVQLIRSKPELWDRCNAVFREPRLKERVWKEVAADMGLSTASCKDGFKHLREKYIREREKSKILGSKYQPWGLLPYMKFLDNHIIPRKKSHSMEFYHCNTSGPIQNSEQEEFSTCNEVENTRTSPDRVQEAINIELENTMTEENSYEPPHFSTQEDFDRALVELVKESHSLWDWKDNTFWNKQARYETWNIIAKKVHKTSSECLLRWKALREKYIREKAKNKENSNFKWRLLDSMSFLDRVIHYRKNLKNDEHFPSDIFSEKVDKLTTEDFLLCSASSTSNADYHYQVIREENSLQGPPTNFFMQVKQEVADVADSSYDSEGSSKKRRLSINSSYSHKQVIQGKSPEELFGELVASLLTRKSEGDRHTAMVEIMKVLAK